MVDEIIEPAAQVEAPSETAKPEVSEARAALVSRWLATMQEDEAFHRDAFKEMRDNQDFAAYGADKAWVKAKKYRVPILARHINQSVSTLYARNPRVVVKRKRRLMYKLWDGRPDSLEIALQGAQMGEPEAVALLQEVISVRRMEKMLDRMSQTLEILWTYFLNEQSANYRQQIKALVRRAKICKIGYIKLGYQRILESRPEIIAKIDDITSKIKAAEAMSDRVAKGEIDDNSADMESLRLTMRDLQAEKDIVVREGPVLDFPKSTTVLIDPACVHVKSLSGANRIAFIYEYDRDQIKEIYNVDVGEIATGNSHASDGKKPISARGGKSGKKTKHRLYEIWDKRLQQVMTVCDGYVDFIKEPATPDAPLERFFPLFPVVFNEVEHEELMFPPSDVENARDIQNEYNRSREALRQHRIAARPFYIEAGRLSEEDKEKLGNHDDHEVITVGALAANEKVENLVQRGPTAPIDPNLYEVEVHFNDLLRVVGSQEANLGGMAGGTATETSIAESSRTKADADNIDDLDEALTEVSKAAGQMMLLEMGKESVIEIVGEGAVWPDMPETRANAAKELLLEVEAGSSGRPNQAQDLANLERVTPLLLQVPGVQPTPIGRRLAELIDLDPDELMVDGNPSITAINAILSKAAQGAPGAEGGGAPQPGTGDPATDPNQQGGQGAMNAPGATLPAPGPQPAFPAPVLS